ncbi:GNAT family N-acetyltransferase [Streptomyces anulatus]|uniref:GNAT family N-acetyltransferase n=1 Tax=Streptomyces anulatus TaxID=1892 RepID=UPI0020B66216|nr:GNAT family N-acetyltransferase [Streptomyces anulatus]
MPRLRQFRTDAATWLSARGSDQWSTPYPDELLLASIQNGDVYLVHRDLATDPVATVTLDRQADPALWTEAEAREPAFYVHKLTLAAPGRGSGLGAELLDWCSDHAARAGATWLRLDAWTSNTRLQSHYERLGFRHVRTVDSPEAYGSGWVGQRPARAAQTALTSADNWLTQEATSRPLVTRKEQDGRPGHEDRRQRGHIPFRQMPG